MLSLLITHSAPVSTAMQWSTQHPTSCFLNLLCQLFLLSPQPQSPIPMGTYFRSCCHQQELHLQHLEFTPYSLTTPFLSNYSDTPPPGIQCLQDLPLTFSLSTPKLRPSHSFLSCFNELLQLGDHTFAKCLCPSVLHYSHVTEPSLWSNPTPPCFQCASGQLTLAHNHADGTHFKIPSTPLKWLLNFARQPALPLYRLFKGIISHLFISPQFSPTSTSPPLSAHGVISNSIMKCLQSASISSLSNPVPLTPVSQLNTSSPERPSLATLAKQPPLVTLSLVTWIYLVHNNISAWHRSFVLLAGLESFSPS